MDVDKAYRWLKNKEEDYRDWRQATEVMEFLATAKGEFAKLEARRQEWLLQEAAAKERLAVIEREAVAAESKKAARFKAVDTDVAAYRERSEATLATLKTDVMSWQSKQAAAKESYEKVIGELETTKKSLDRQVATQGQRLADLEVNIAKIRQAVA